MMQSPRLPLSFAFAFVCLWIAVGLPRAVAQDAPEAQAAPEEQPAPAEEAAPADEAAPAEEAAPATEAAQPSGDLKKDVENFWHYGKIARYDLAAAEAQKILAKSDQPVAVLEAFELVTTARKDNLDEWLLRWQGVDAMKDPATQLINLISEGHRQRRSDPGFIEENIKRLATNERAYALGLARLRESGELAVPIMIDYLRDPSKAQHHGSIRRALRDLGRLAVNPLVAATEMKDNDTLIVVVSALGDIGYDAVVPYLARLASSKDAAPAVQTAATQALFSMGAGDPKNLNVADLYYGLAEKFYYDNASIAADPRRPNANVWYWDDEKGLLRKEVASAIFNEIMSMRANEYTLKLNPEKGEAVSLWLAANYKREAELPEGSTDPTRGENQPAAHYYGVAAGTQYLNNALARSLRDRNSAVALRVIKSLQEIVGESNMFAGEEGQPLIQALAYPDRLVRFEAAFALAEALPQKPFTGQERVVPLLAEAASQTGKPNILVVVPEDRLNALVQGLKEQGYGAAGAPNAAGALSTAATLPSVDVILVSEQLDATEIDQLFVQALQNPRLERSAKLVMATSAASPFTARAVDDSLINVTQASDAAGLKDPIEKARQRSGALPIDEKVATEYALRAAELLGRLAISRGQVFDLSAGQTTLLATLEDTRPDVVKAVGNVLGLLNSKDAQVAVLTKAVDEKTADDVKVSLFKSLATSAKFFGNQLDAGQIDSLQKSVEGAENLEVRSAAAEARGALNLPADQAKTLIVNQSRV